MQNHSAANMEQLFFRTLFQRSPTLELSKPKKTASEIRTISLMSSSGFNECSLQVIQAGFRSTTNLCFFRCEYANMQRTAWNRYQGRNSLSLCTVQTLFPTKDFCMWVYLISFSCKFYPHPSALLISHASSWYLLIMHSSETEMGKSGKVQVRTCTCPSLMVDCFVVEVTTNIIDTQAREKVAVALFEI